MSIRKRRWNSPQGESKEAWVVDYVDGDGDRHLKTFARKRDAEAWLAVVGIEVRSGLHTADSKSATVAEAGQLWLQTAREAGLERSTLEYYQQHLDLHIAPLIGSTKLSQLTVPMVRAFEDKLRADRSPAMVRKAIGSLAALLTLTDSEIAVPRPSWPGRRNTAANRHAVVRPVTTIHFVGGNKHGRHMATTEQSADVPR